MNNGKLIKVFTVIALIFIILLSFSNNVFADGGGSKREIPDLVMDSDGQITIKSEWMNNEDNTETNMNTILEKLTIFVVFALGLATMLLFVIFIRNFVSLAASKDPRGRSEAFGSLVNAAMGAIGIGSITLFVALFYNLL